MWPWFVVAYLFSTLVCQGSRLANRSLQCSCDHVIATAAATATKTTNSPFRYCRLEVRSVSSRNTPYTTPSSTHA